LPLVSEKTPRWRNIVGLTLLIIILVVGYLTFTRLGSQGDAVNATRDSVERTDCARQVNAEQSKVRDAATLADRAANRADGLATSFYFQAVLEATVTGARVTQEQKDDFSQLLTDAEMLRRRADNADAAVAALPDPAKEVDRRCPN